MFATQQVIGDGVLFGNASIVQANDYRQAEHGDERDNLGHPAYLVHGGHRLSVYQLRDPLDSLQIHCPAYFRGVDVKKIL